MTIHESGPRARRAVTARPRRSTGRLVATATLLGTAPLLGLAVSTAHADEINAEWTPFFDGLWSVPIHWDPFGVPDNDGVDFYNVRIGGEADEFVTVTLDIDATINRLTIDGGDRLRWQNNHSLTFIGGPIVNNGVIEMTSTDVVTPNRFVIDGTVSLTGTGAFVTDGFVDNILCANVPGSRLINDSVPLTGTAIIGDDTLSYTSSALIEANLTDKVIIIDPPSDGDFTNFDQVRASSGGAVRLEDGLYLNHLGVFRPLDGSFIRLTNDVTIAGGILDSVGTGFNQVDGVVRFEGVTNSGQVVVQPVRELTLAGSFTNSGQLRVESVNDFGNDLIIEGDLTLDGGGEVLFPGNANAAVFTHTPGDRLTNADNVIRGAGRIGLDVLNVTNGSVIEATNSPQQPIILDPPPGGDLTNDGVIRTVNGAAIRFGAGFYDNTNGLIEFDADGGFAALQAGAEIQGGILRSTGTGNLRVRGTEVRYRDLVHDADTVVEDTRRLVLEGTIDNLGDIEVFSFNVFATTLRMDGEVTLQGGGTLTLSGNVASVVDAVADGDRLVNLDHTITGAGRIGHDILDVEHHGTIIATGITQELIIDPPASGAFLNAGELRAGDGSTLQLMDGLIDNVDGLIEASPADGTVRLRAGTRIVGGTLRSSGTGRVVVDASGVRYDSLVHDAHTLVQNNRQLILEHALTNLGDIELVSTDVFATDLSIDGDVTLDGGGTITLSGNTAVGIDALTEGDRLTNLDNAIRGRGTLGRNLASLTNQGSIDASHETQALTIDPPAIGDFTNLGTVLVSGAGGLRIAAGPMDQAGTVVIPVDRKLDRLAGDYMQTAGSTQVDGELEVDAGVVDLRGGTLTGDGLVDSDVLVGTDVAPATIAPTAASADDAIGALDVMGALTLGPAAVVELDLGGTVGGVTHDLVHVTGAVLLDGTLRIAIADGYAPQIDDAFDVVIGGSVTGAFADLDAPTFPGIDFEAQILPDRVRVVVVEGGGPPADLDGDGNVGLADLLIVLSAWGVCDPGPCPADLDGDGSVGLGDLVSVLAAWS